MVNDTVANMITSIRNANIVKATTVRIPATNTTKEIGKILSQEGFITNLREHKENTRSWLILTLKYRGRRKKPCITNSKRISKPGLRIYSNHREIPKVLGGMGIVILSTSSGIVTDREARQKQIGGEILCYVW
uniref:Small ribosomal subunit protein uS8c n=1 Tax=Christensenia aesculifolia TaxID=491817 RepID=A0A5C0F7P4_9MONI|nr:ribosomal protein S8 [Christensenia aesculifolia]QEI60365.1 ribosomal protein S8 [Christensenia aesculifolia]